MICNNSGCVAFCKLDSVDHDTLEMKELGFLYLAQVKTEKIAVCQVESIIVNIKEY